MALAAGLTVLFVWSLYPAAKLDYMASRSLAGTKQQQDSLKQRNDTARKEIGALQTPAGVEKAAREDLGLAKPGENVYVVVPSEQATGSQAGAAGTSAASVATAPTPSLLQAVLDAVFGVAQPTTTVEP
jgi:hypothetical protein